jgi:type I restriction enzyme M protein
MTKPLPKWIQTRYAILWNKFKDKEFTFEDAEKILKDKSGILVFFSDLRKAGWLEVTLNFEDARKRIYRLKSPEKAIEEMSRNKD